MSVLLSVLVDQGRGVATVPAVQNSLGDRRALRPPQASLSPTQASSGPPHRLGGAATLFRRWRLQANWAWALAVAAGQPQGLIICFPLALVLLIAVGAALGSPRPSHPSGVRVRICPRPCTTAAGGRVCSGLARFRTHPPAPVGPGPHSAFNAASYTLDVLIPAPALAQASDWDPHGYALAVATGLHILGWLLAITVIAAITRSFSRT